MGYQMRYGPKNVWSIYASNALAFEDLKSFPENEKRRLYALIKAAFGKVSWISCWLFWQTEILMKFKLGFNSNEQASDTKIRYSSSNAQHLSYIVNFKIYRKYARNLQNTLKWISWKMNSAKMYAPQRDLKKMKIARCLDSGCASWIEWVQSLFGHPAMA